jgi:hypothetical protein
LPPRLRHLGPGHQRSDRPGSVAPSGNSLMKLSALRVAHALPGRVRLKVPALKSNGDLAQAVCEKLETVDAVLEVRASPLTGSLLVRYDTSRIPSLGAFHKLIEPIYGLVPGAQGSGRCRRATHHLCNAEPPHATARTPPPPDTRNASSRARLTLPRQPDGWCAVDWLCDRDGGDPAGTPPRGAGAYVTGTQCFRCANVTTA